MHGQQLPLGVRRAAERAWFGEALGVVAAYIQLDSAGTRVVVGNGMHPDTALVFEACGAEPGDFRARQLVAAHLAEADFVLTMTCSRRGEVLALVPRGLARAFTLREAAGLLALLDGRDGNGPTRGRGMVTALNDARSRRQGGGDDDVAVLGAACSCAVHDTIQAPSRNRAPREEGWPGELALRPSVDAVIARRTPGAGPEQSRAGGVGLLRGRFGR